MPKKNENLLGKLIQKDYNNVLEKTIETKNFDENVKNLLLEIFYKIDVSYKDYKKVKRNVESKQEYTERIIKIINDNCNTIKNARPNSEEAEILGDRTFLVDSQKKLIICYPIERKLLYSICKIEKQEKIIRNKYFLIDKTISDLINIGNNINMVEPLRDFNGWSWLTIKKEIENISYNLIYQNLRILVGEKFLNSWITDKEYIIDYYEEFKNELSEKFGTQLKEKLISLLERISILLEMEVNLQYIQELQNIQQENAEKLQVFNNKKEFTEKLTEEKKQINIKIKDIEKILSSKKLLEKQYAQINENKKPDEKIFSIKILEKQLKEQKEDLLDRLDSNNQLLNPKKFIEKKETLEKQQELLKIIELRNNEEEKYKTLEEFQKTFLECFLVFVRLADLKEDIIDLIYTFRYYNLLPFNEQIDIYQNNNLNEKLIEVENLLIKKAIDKKIIFTPSDNIEQNIKLLRFIFQTRIISFEDIYMTVIKEKDKYYVELSENNENSYEEKFETDIPRQEKLNIKFNKKNKLLN